jgi:hypothetical protein
MSDWFASAKLPHADEGMSAGDGPDPSLGTPPDKSLRTGQRKASKKENEPRRSRQPAKTVNFQKEPAVSAPTEAVRRQGADRQSPSSTTAPSGLRSLWPEPPAPGSFSR